MAWRSEEIRDYGWPGLSGVASRIFQSGDGVMFRWAALAVIAVSFGTLFVAGVAMDKVAPGAVVAAPVLLIAGIVILAACRGQPWALRACMVVFILTIDSAVRGSPASPLTFDAQVLAKMLVTGGILIVGVANLPASMRYFRSVPAMALSLYLTLAVASCLYSPEPLFTLIHSVSFIAIFLFAGALVARLGFRDIMMTSLLVLGFHVVITLALAPLGRVPPVWMISGEGGNVVRLQGFVGHPLRLADVASLWILCAWVMWLQGWLRLRFLLIVLALGAVTLALAHERMPIAACLLGLMSLGRYRPLAVWFVLATALAALFAAILAPGIITAFATAISRGGGAEEIFTLTGRLELWRQSLIIFMDRPLFGFGFSAAGHVLAERYHVPRGGSLPSGAEGMIPQSLLSLGLIGTALLILTLVSLIVFAVRNRNSVLNPFICYAFFTGVTTASAIGRSVNGATLYWMMAICLVAAFTVPHRSTPARRPAGLPLPADTVDAGVPLHR